jgi:N utilization substance protein A
MELDMKQLAIAIKSIAEEKNLPEDVVQDAVEQALAAAYRRDFGEREQEVRVTMNLNTGQVDAFVTKTIETKVEDPVVEITLADAKKINPEAKLGDEVEVHESITQFGRVAAQTAKQVILQRLREAEREIIMNEYEDKIGTVINGIVARVEGRIVRVD